MYPIEVNVCSMAVSDLTELDLPGTMKLEHPDSDNLLSFFLIITPDEGLLDIFTIYSSLTAVVIQECTRVANFDFLS